MDIEFKKITEFPRGTLAALLKDSYSFEPKFGIILQNMETSLEKLFIFLSFRNILRYRVHC